MKNLIFSFIIPAHNEEDVIKDCIESIEKQPEKNYEIVVTNDGSTDKTRKIVEELMEKNPKIKLPKPVINAVIL